MVPPCCSIMFLHDDSPNPVPFSLVVKSGSNNLSNISGGMFGPESDTFISISSLLIFDFISTLPSALPIAWIAFKIIFVKTVSSFFASHKIVKSKSCVFNLILFGRIYRH